MGLFDRIKNNRFAKENGLSYADVLLYNEKNKNGDYSIEKFKLFLQAMNFGISDNDFEDYFSTYRNLATLEEYKAYIIFGKENPTANLSYSEYQDYVKSYSAIYSAYEYKTYFEAKKSGLSEEEAKSYAKEYQSKYSLSRYIDYLDATKHGWSLDEYDRRKKARLIGIPYETLDKYEKCQSSSYLFSEEECKSFATTNLDVSIERYHDICQAKHASISLTEYDEWKSEYSRIYSVEKYAKLCKARQRGMSLEDYEEDEEAKSKGLSVEDYRLYKTVQRYGLSVNEFVSNKSIIQSIQKTRDKSIIRNVSQIYIAERLGIKHIVLSSAFSSLPSKCFSDMTFERIDLPVGLTSIGSGAFCNCKNLKEICIPGTVKEVPRGIFDGCVSLEKIVLLEGITKVNITGWYDLPMLKSVISACTITDIGVDQSSNYRKEYCLENITDAEKPRYDMVCVQLQRFKNDYETSDSWTKKFQVKNFPNLKVLIIDGEVDSLSIENCPRLKAIILDRVDSSICEFYKNGNIKKIHNLGESNFNLSDELNNGELRFFIVKRMLKKLYNFNNASFRRLSWVHVSPYCENVSKINAPMLAGIGLPSAARWEDSFMEMILSFPSYSLPNKNNEYSTVTKKPFHDAVPFQVSKLSVKQFKFENTTYKMYEQKATFHAYLKVHGSDQLNSASIGIEGVAEFSEGTVTIPSGLLNNTAINRVCFPSSIDTIDSDAFCNCNLLEEVDFWGYPPHISETAFSGCKRIKVKYYGADNQFPIKLYRHKKFSLPQIDVMHIHDVSVPANYYSRLPIRKLVIGQETKQIGQRAFSGCLNLESVEILGEPNISDDAFEKCVHVKKVAWNPIKYTKIAGQTGFPEVKEQIINQTTTVIGEQAFAGWGLEAITIPQGIRSIGEKAFIHNSSLKWITISGNPESFASDAFENCINVEKIDFGNCKHYKIAGSTGFPKVAHVFINEEILNIESETFANWGLEEIVIPQSVESIGSKAFADNKKLSTIIINGNPLIAPNAFGGCKAVSKLMLSQNQKHCTAISGTSGFPKINNISIPLQVVEIEPHCFEGWGISKVEIPSSVKKIGSRAFASTPITEIIIHGNPEIAPDAFESCHKVVSVSRESEEVITCIAGRTGFPGVKTYAISEKVHSIDKRAFWGWGIEKLSIPNTVKEIGAKAFSNCNNLYSVSFPDDIKISEYAFANCPALQEVNNKGSGVYPIDLAERFGCELFYGCNRLSTLYLSSAIDTKLLKGILSSNEIERVYISSGISSSLYFALLSNKSIVEILPLELEEKMRDPKKIRVLPKCSGNLQKLFVPQCINRIPEDSLDQCANLEELYLSPSVIIIDREALRTCKKIKSIKLHKALRTWMKGIYTPSKVKLVDYGSIEKDLFTLETVGLSAELPQEITEVRKQQITKIVISEGATSISDSAFAEMRNLREVVFSNTLTKIGASAFLNCVSLEAINVPDSVTDVGEMAFEGCSSLSSIHISRNASRLRKSIFKQCTNLTAISGLDNIGYIEEEAFYYCSSLKRLVFSKEIFSIKNCFSHCESLEELIIPVDIAEFIVDLTDCTSLRVMYLPQNIDSFKCIIPQGRQITINALRGSSWKAHLISQNITYFKKADLQETLDIILQEEGYQLDDYLLDEREGNRSKKEKVTVPSKQSNSRTTNNRAGWSVSGKQTDDTQIFTAGPTDINDVIESMTDLEKNSMYTESDAEIPDIGSVFKEYIHSEEPPELVDTITSNIFTCSCQYSKINKKQFAVCMMNHEGHICSSIKEIKVVKVDKHLIIKTQLQIHPGISNGVYYVVYYCKEKSQFQIQNIQAINVDIAFVVDDEFAF